MKTLGRLVPGMVIVVILMRLATRIAGGIPLLDALTAGIILGIFVNNLVRLPRFTREGIRFVEKKVLQWGIILLGLDLNFALVWQLGGKILLLVVFVVVFGLVMSYLLAKLCGVNTKLSTLIGVGSSICGVSAIAAVEPIIESEKEDLAISAAVISLLGAAGVLMFPLLGSLLSLNEVSFGVWAGSSLQGVAHAVAGAFAYGELSGEIGTLVKMGRVVLLAPVALALTFVFARGKGKAGKNLFPTYVLAFVLVGVLSTVGLLQRAYTVGGLTLDLKLASRYMINAAMIAMGLSVSFKSLGGKGLRAMLLGAMLFALITAATICLITFLGI